MIDFSKNYFELFDLPERYHIDSNQLSTRFRELQSEYHPDKFATASDAIRRQSVQVSSLLNEAQATLKNDMLRAKYILTLKAVDFNPEHETTKDVAFLMQQLELREALENIAQTDDPFESLEAMQQDIEKQLSSLVNQVDQDLSISSESSLEKVKENILKMQFLQKFQWESEKMEEKLEEAL